MSIIFPIDHYRSQPGLQLLPAAAALQPGVSVPAPSGVTPTEVDPDDSKPNKRPGKASKGAAKDVAMLTPLERGKDLEQKVIKLKGECGNLQCQMQTLEFGAGLAKELGKLEKEFECCPENGMLHDVCNTAENDIYPVLYMLG